jgi:hypothetical protein
MRLMRKIGAKAILHRFHLAFQDSNSISCAELELAGFSGLRDYQAAVCMGKGFSEARLYCSDARAAVGTGSAT